MLAFELPPTGIDHGRVYCVGIILAQNSGEGAHAFGCARSAQDYVLELGVSFRAHTPKVRHAAAR